MAGIYDKFHPAGTVKYARRTTDPSRDVLRTFVPAGIEVQAFDQGVYIGKDTLYWPVEGLRPGVAPDGPAEDLTVHGSTPLYSHIFPASGTLYDYMPPVTMPQSWDPLGYMEAYFAWYCKIGGVGQICNWQMTGFALNRGGSLTGNYAQGITEVEDASTVVADPVTLANSLQLSAGSARFRFTGAASMSSLFLRVRRVTSVSDTLEQNAHLLGVGLRFETRSDADD